MEQIRFFESRSYYVLNVIVLDRMSVLVKGTGPCMKLNCFMHTESSKIFHLPTLEAIFAYEFMTNLDDWGLQRPCLGIVDVLQ